MSQYSVDADSDVPPFEQLRIQIAGRIAAGTLPPGSRLPTVRALAEELGLAVNTVAKTYRALETDGSVVTQGRRGTFVPLTSSDHDDAAAAARVYAATARRQGLGLTEASRLLEQAW